MTTWNVGDKHTFSDGIYKVYHDGSTFSVEQNIAKKLKDKGHKTKVTKEKNKYNVWIKV